MLAVDPNYRVARGIVPVRSLVSSLYARPGPLPELVYGISDMDMLERVFTEFSVDFGFPARLEANVRSRFLYTSIKGPVYGRSDQRLLRESRYLPPDQLEGCADLTIIGDTVVFMTVTTPGQPPVSKVKPSGLFVFFRHVHPFYETMEIARDVATFATEVRHREFEQLAAPNPIPEHLTLCLGRTRPKVRQYGQRIRSEIIESIYGQAHSQRIWLQNNE